MSTRRTNSKLPSGWQTTELGEVAELRRGLSWAKSQERATPSNGCVPVLRIPNVQDRLELDDILYLDGVTPKDIAECGATAGWSLMVASNGNPDRVGNCVLIDRDTEYVFASFLVAVGTRDGARLASEFLYRLLCSETVQRAVTRNVQGSTGLSNINLNLLLRQPVPIPPPAEQAKIAGVLGAVDEAVARSRAVVAQTKTLRQAVLHTLLTRGLPGQRTKFTTVRLGDLYAERRENGIEGLPIMSVTANGLVPRSSVDRRVESELEDEGHALVRKGDLAYNMMRMWQGVSGLAACDCLVSPAYVVCSPKEGLVPEYGALLLKAPHVVRLLHLHSQGVHEDRLRLYFKHFAPIKVEVPDEDTQRAAVRMIASLDARLTAAEAHAAQLEKQKSALSAALLSGALQVLVSTLSPSGSKAQKGRSHG